MFHSNRTGLRISKEQLDLDPGRTEIYYMEKPPEFSMQGLQTGIIAVTVIVILAVIARIMLVISRKNRMAKYEKDEIKVIGEMHKELNT